MSLSTFNNTLTGGKTPAKATTLGEYSPPQGTSTVASRHHFGVEGDNHHRWQHLYVLPVLLMEFLALALTRAALPSMLVEQYGDNVYVVMGICDCVRGMLAFLACPLFGKISDDVGRRICLFITVMGTCAPVCSLAFFPWDATPVAHGGSRSLFSGLSSDEGLSVGESSSLQPEDPSEAGGIWSMIWGPASNSEYDDEVHLQYALHPHALPTFVVLLSLSGVFSSTFTLVFAYISDTVHHQEERVSAYGLALATFGLSFTIGPLAGGYLARSHKQYVFTASLVLTLLDLLYIYAVLPESRTPRIRTGARETPTYNITWNPVDTLRIIAVDPFLRKVSKVAFLYYTGLWALISTISVYAVKRFHLGPERLGELMSALGLCTMVAEAVLVRIMVPMFGEKKSMKIGLFSFAIQCVVLGFSYEPWHLFVCAFFSLLGNLVYPSLTSLVSGSVEPSAVGEALGAVNGVKALTEGIGPLVFGTLMTLSEKSALPGWPYLLAALLVIAAYHATDELPDAEDDIHEYVHELERKQFRQSGLPTSPISQSTRRSERPIQSAQPSPVLEGFKRLFEGASIPDHHDSDDEIELEGLLSDVDESFDESPSNKNDG